VVVRRLGQSELGEDALDMRLDGALGDEQQSGNGVV
jgi:hypothetical protein